MSREELWGCSVGPVSPKTGVKPAQLSPAGGLRLGLELSPFPWQQEWDEGRERAWDEGRQTQHKAAAPTQLLQETPGIFPPVHYFPGFSLHLLKPDLDNQEYGGSGITWGF